MQQFDIPWYFKARQDFGWNYPDELQQQLVGCVNNSNHEESYSVSISEGLWLCSMITSLVFYIACWIKFLHSSTRLHPPLLAFALSVTDLWTSEKILLNPLLGCIIITYFGLWNKVIINRCIQSQSNFKCALRACLSITQLFQMTGTHSSRERAFGSVTDFQKRALNSSIYPLNCTKNFGLNISKYGTKVALDLRARDVVPL